MSCKNIFNFLSLIKDSSAKINELSSRISIQPSKLFKFFYSKLTYASRKFVGLARNNEGSSRELNYDIFSAQVLRKSSKMLKLPSNRKFHQSKI